MKKKVLLRAPLLTMSGYGVHSRQIFRWLESRSDQYDFSVNTLPWGNTSWLIDSNKLNGLIGRIMNKSGKSKDGYDISIQVQLPNEWDPSLAKFNVGVTAAVETDKANPSWLNNVNSMDMIIVPSEHSKKSLLNAGSVNKRIEVVPEAFIDEIKEEELVTLPEFGTKFNFLIFGQITGQNAEDDRKNTYNTIKWLCELFKKDKDVGIVIKTNSARNCLFDRERTKDILNNILKNIRGENNLPPVYFIHGDMNDKEVASLYRHPQIKALVALTKGEGFGLPILEAAASGLPVIATNWSGHLDFMEKGKFLKVDYDLKEIPKTKIDKRKCPVCQNGCTVCSGTGFTQIFVEGSKWAEPKEKSAKSIIKKFREMPDTPKEWAEKLATTIREEYSQEAIQNHYDLVFSDIAV